MSLTSELDGSSSDLEAAKINTRTKLRSLESVYRKNQIDAIMEMGEALSQLHQKYSAAGCRQLWKQEFGDLQLRMSRRTAERYRKIYNAFNDCPALWEKFKLGALVLLAEFADREGRQQGVDAIQACLQTIKAIAANRDGIIRRIDADHYCHAWVKFADRPELLKRFTVEALNLLMFTGNDGAIRQAEYAAADLEQDAATGKLVEPIGLEQVQAIIENFASDGDLPEDAESLDRVEAQYSAVDMDGFEDEDSADEDGSDVEAEADEDVDETATIPQTETFEGNNVPSSRKFVKTYQLSKYEISIASDIGPVTHEEIDAILDELRVVLQSEVEGELAGAR